ncbi:MAG: phospholipase D-like domain-containing protein, partial [Bacteroidetes bacterium]|nr:phospholipase D-like domain-containing protein [Bacteroidota bacterium]
YHNFKDFMGFPNMGHKELQYSQLPPLKHKDLFENRSVLSIVRERDIMLNFPYQSFQYIIDLLREASIDPKVRSIKMTIYRAAKNSSVINALINAARNGKYVTVFMELQARFDEEANIYWTERLRDEGVKVIHGIPGFKVHSKLILIRRKESNKDFFGICVILPGVEGLSENIQGISIVDRFLEHARVLVFANGGKPLYYITSADWMVRNFDNRVEVACPVEDKDLRKELQDMIDIELADNVKARIIAGREANRYKNGGTPKLRSQIEFYNYLKAKLG